MHCRIGCRINGGFLECTDDELNVLVNDVPRNRVRLTHGDVVKIGDVEMTVDFPQREIKRSFDLAGEENSTTDAEVSDSEVEASAEVWESESDSPSPPESEKQVFDFDVDDADGEGIGGEAVFENLVFPPPAETPPPVEVPESTIANQESASKGQAQPDKDEFVFEFDSVDAHTTSVTAEDLAVAKNMSGETITVEDPEVLSSFDDDTEDQRPDVAVGKGSEEPTSEDSENMSDQLEGGSLQAGKFWRWSGTSAVLAGLGELFRDDRKRLTCYQVSEHVDLQECSLEVVQEAVQASSTEGIYLVINGDPSKVFQFLISKKWHERMKHPEALNISISILPARHVSALFEQIDSIVLVQKSGADLLRIDQQKP